VKKGGGQDARATVVRASCPRHRGPGILPGVKWSHMISRLNANIRLSSGCLRLDGWKPALSPDADRGGGAATVVVDHAQGVIAGTRLP